MKKVSADLVITNDSAPIKNGVVTYDEATGEILRIDSEPEYYDGVQRLSGILCPGYINAHCHLELSHMKGLVPTGTGLIPFIKDVVTKRNFPREEILEKIAAADQEMYDNGIVAVGDISNQIDTVETKRSSKIRYYTFVEMFDFLQEDNADTTLAQYQEVYDQHLNTGGHRKSLVPHAPYSVSKRLFQHINQQNTEGATLSIHNQELHAENELFIAKEGDFIDFYKYFGIDISNFNPSGQPSIYYTFAELKPTFKTLMVHNTMTTTADVMAALAWNPQTYWATCANANLYIENKLPDYQALLAGGATICVGTDSLTSNWQLSIYEELKTIKRYQSHLDDLELIRWATVHGAQALGYQDLGKLVTGVKPGINWIEVPVDEESFHLNEAVGSTRVV